MTRYSPTANPLWDRLSQAVGAHDPSLDDKILIQSAFEGVPSDKMDSATFEDLRPEVQEAVERCEALSPTSWEDPLDAPDDLD